MTLIYNNIRQIQLLAFSVILPLFMINCSQDDTEAANANKEAVISLSLKAATLSINEDKVLWEDRVEELRMIVFNSDNGAVTFNRLVDFPNGFSNRSEAIPFNPSTYDFLFIANESAYSDFGSALQAISNISDLNSNNIFKNLIYNENFVPDGTTKGGLFLMSAEYDGIVISGGGTIDNPLPLPLPTSKVELVRALAKVEIIFRKKETGSTVPAITSFSLSDVASEYSVPTTNDFYTGSLQNLDNISLSEFSYERDSIGSLTFFIPELLRSASSGGQSNLVINGNNYPLQTDNGFEGLTYQRRSIASLSANSIIRNYYYQINAYINPTSTGGGIEIKACIQPWEKNVFQYMFYGDNPIVIPPVVTTDSTVIITTDCGKIEMRYNDEILPQGLQGAYGDQVVWWDPAIQGPRIQKGDPPYYCEQKYGAGWRLINSCELMSFLALFDTTYKIWESNTWIGATHALPFYPLQFRQQAQDLLEKLSGVDLSHFVLTDNGKDTMGDEKLGILDQYFTPGDIMLREIDYPGGWPYTSPPNNNGLKWYPSEVAVQIHGYWYENYINLSDRNNWDKILYQEFERYDYSRTVSRCVRSVQ